MRNKGKQERISSPGGAGKALACPFAARDGGRSRREAFNPAQLSPPGAWERLPWISPDWRAPAAPRPGDLSGVRDGGEDARGSGGATAGMFLVAGKLKRFWNGMRPSQECGIPSPTAVLMG